MQTWKNASSSDLNLFSKISTLLSQHPELLNSLFDKSEARLSTAPEVLLKKARGLCSGEQVLLKICIDLWCGQGGCLVNELFDHEDFIMPKLIKALYGPC